MVYSKYAAAPTWLTGLSVSLAVAILLPLAAVAVAAVGALWQPATLLAMAQSVLLGYMVNTVMLCAIAAAVALVVGISGAWFISGYDFFGKRLFQWSLVLPMAMPAYVLAYAYTDALDPSGWLYREIVSLLAHFGIVIARLDIRSLWGAGLLLGVALSPYVAMLAKNAFEERQGAALDAARAMGLNSRQVFFRVALPLARPAWMAGLALVMMECFADFGTVAFFSVPTLATGLFKAWFSYGDRASASFLALVMMLSVLVLIAIEHRARGGAAWAAPRIGSKAKPTPLRGRKAFLAMLVCATPGLFGFVFPVMLLVHAALAAQTSPNWGTLLQQAGNTLVLGVVAALVIVPAAWLGAYALRYRHSVAAILVRIAGSGYAMPGLVIAVGLLAWSSLFTETADAWFGWRVALVGTGILLIGAYLTRFFAVGLSAIDSGLGRITRNIEWSAASLGLTPWQVFARVHFPMMRSATGVAVLLVFVDVVKELPATLVLRPFNFETLSVAAHHLASDELLSAAAWPALMIALTGLLPLILLGPTLKR